MTTGNALAAWSVFEGVHRILELRTRKFEDMTIGIVDAMNPIGKSLSRKFAECAGKLILSSPYKESASRLAEIIRAAYPLPVSVGDSVKEADVVVVTTSLKEGLFHPKVLNPERCFLIFLLIGGSPGTLRNA